MDARSVTGVVKQPSWKLKAEIAQNTQGLVVTGFGNLPYGYALFLELGDSAKGGGWLTALQQVAPITNASPPEGASPAKAAALAFSWTGLHRMGLADTAMASFSRPFQEGMLQEDRSRRLGDRRRGKWCDPVIEGGPLWSANTRPKKPVESVHAFDVRREPDEEPTTTSVGVHAVALLYTEDTALAGQLAAEVEAVLVPYGVRVVRRVDLLLDAKEDEISREHFGFADGMSQPAPFDETGAVTIGGQEVRNRDKIQGAPLGDFLIGYSNSHNEKAPGPVVPGPLPELDLQDRLPPHEEAQGFFDFGLNGTYLVIRELRQDVAKFWLSMDECAEEIRKNDPDGSSNVTGEWVAERVIGRNRDGHLLCPGGYLPPANGRPQNEFLFLKDDPRGAGCPMGSHVRRAHPRDSLAPTKDLGDSLLAAANNHRIIRRGRKFGPKIANDRIDDRTERGLLFMCLNTDIARQFEFIQQIWLLNSNFATLFGETDPLVGADGPMTLRDRPLRRTINVKTYVQMAGGDYFFLPSIPALKYLEKL